MEQYLITFINGNSKTIQVDDINKILCSKEKFVQVENGGIKFYINVETISYIIKS